MAALASMVSSRLAVWPRLLSVAALLGLTLAGGHESHRPEPAREVARIAAVLVPVPAPRPLGRVLRPAELADAREWPRGMVITPPETGDPMAVASVPAPLPPGPVVALLSGLFELLGSRGA